MPSATVEAVPKPRTQMQNLAVRAARNPRIRAARWKAGEKWVRYGVEVHRQAFHDPRGVVVQLLLQHMEYSATALPNSE